MAKQRVWKNYLVAALSSSVMMLSATTAFADSTELSLDDSIAMALQNNPSIKMAVKDQEKAGYGIDQAKAGKMPSLSLGTSGTHGDTTAGQVDDSFSTSLKLSMPLYTGGKLESTIDQAKINAESAQQGVVKAQEELRLDAANAYYTVLQSQNLVQVNEETVTSLEEHLKTVQAQYEVGTVAKADVLRSEVELANAKQNLTKAKNNYDVAVSSLNNIIGAPLATEHVYKDSLQYAPYDTSLDDSIAMALAKRPEIIQSQYNIAASKAGVEIAKSGNRPTVSMSGSQGWSGSDFPGDNKNWSVGVAANWNVFDSGLTNAQVKGAQAVLDKAEEQDAQTRSSIELEVRQNYSSMQEAKERIDTSQVAVNKAEEDLSIAKVKYGAGAGTNLDVIDAQVALTQAKTNYTQALYDYNVNKAKVIKAVALQAGN